MVTLFALCAVGACVLLIIRTPARSLIVSFALSALFIEEVFASAQNATASSTQAPSYLRLGYQVYDAAMTGVKAAPIAIAGGLVFVVSGMQLMSDRPRRRVLIAGLGWMMLEVFSTAAIGEGTTRIISSCIPPLLVLAGVSAGVVIKKTTSTNRLELLVLTLVTVKAAEAIAVFAGVGTSGPDFVLFYDSLTPSICGAVIVAILLRGFRGRIDYIAIVSSAVVLALSLRRAPVLAAGCGALVAIILMRRLRVVARIAALVVAVVALAPSGLRSRMTAAIAAYSQSSTPGADGSAAGHFADISLGLRYLHSAGPFGMGYDAPQLPELAASNASRLYLHDEYIYTWLAAGPFVALGEMLVIALATWVALRCVVTMRRGATSFVECVAACFLLQAPVLFVFFPYLSTTSRWPIAYGLALGFVIVGHDREQRPAEPRLAARPSL